MNKPFIAYMTEQEKLQKIKDKAIKSNITKGISIFFITSLVWFGYTIFKIILV